MGRTWRVGVLAIVLGLVCAMGVPAATAVLPLPTPPTLPPTTPPAAVEPLLAVTGPTVGALCGTISLGVLLTPSLASGFFHIPIDALIDRHTLNAYSAAALYVCGFVPSPLTQTQCQTDRQILDALRGLNPLAAQVVGLFPEGATVDTVLAVEALLPSSATIAGPVVADLSKLMDCTRASGAPPSKASASTTTVPHAAPTPAPAAPSALPPAPLALPAVAQPAHVATPTAVVPGPAPPAAVARPTIDETRLIARHGFQVLGLVLGLALLLATGFAWLWSRSPSLASKMTPHS